MNAVAEAPAAGFPTPFSRRRNALRKLPLIRMAQEQLEGIANVTYGTVETLTWETATDWDNRVSQDPNVVHDSFGDLEGAGVVQLGYPSSDFGGNTAKKINLPVDEASGASTATNVSGSADFSVIGGTFGATGHGNTTAIDLDGTDDLLECNDDAYAEGAGQYTLFTWINFDSLGNNRRILSYQGQNTGSDVVLTLRTNGSNLELLTREDANGTLNQTAGTTSLSTGVWYALAARVDAAGGNQYIYIDGTEEASSSATLSTNSGAWDASADAWSVGAIQKDDGSNEFTDGTVDWPQVWTRTVTATDIADLSSKSGTLTTATKTFSSAVQPDLSNLDYSLNGQSIDLDVIGSPGTASEEVVTQTLDGSTGYTLTWSDTHQDFRIRPNISTTDITTSPVVRSVTLTS